MPEHRSPAPTGSPSWQARLAVRAFGLVPGAVVHRVFTHPPRLRTPLVPRSLAERHDVVVTEVGGGRVATVTPADAYDHVFFLHGGAYTLQAQHWPFLGRLVRRGHAVSLVDYPLAPEHTVDETVPMVRAAWAAAAAASAAAGRPAPVLAGDSAGGGLALTLLQQLRDEGATLPRASVLLSPWVDAVMTDAGTVAADRLDPLLSRRALHGAARLYAGPHGLDDPRVSPGLGDLARLGRVLTLVGTRELFWPQCERLAERAARAEGTDLELRVREGLPHDWALFPGLPEQRDLADELVAWLGRP
ncbi:Monoterpene epsilon-lactone hydrolase [Nocardioides dokdonensis FR1436]|uniref:Monoterpene epsilon-lactone hydrolase n=1 Tax=Nocardioides dokdonensis FR1436 TaxID=1300347 RepID=A0A1A9GIH8_9ACTN|nr:alpha/beta hydrolase fold domain-containing protein [Nocardioides dokdonensis]ANH38044.1 Monoterpene epsilon-lactone hydrolase [Nocardioides dokdonensis FR1436]